MTSSTQGVENSRGRHAVVIAGGGPTGLMLGAELTLAGADALVIERRPNQELDGSRAGGLHARTLEVLDLRGIAERFLREGQVMQIQGFAGIPLDISDFPTRHNYGLALWQRDFERILAGWAGAIGVRVAYGREVVAFTERDDVVDVQLDNGESFECQFLVGCDGGRSTVRKGAGVDFAGVEASTSWIIAEVEMVDTPPIGMRPEGGGIGPVNIGSGTGPYRVVLKERETGHDSDPTLDDLREALRVTYGSDFGAHSPGWISRFSDMSRQAAEYRRGRILLAGDAAHVHPPQGGQGLNTGVQDAVNLGWKLSQVVSGRSAPSLLDTYHAERHPVAARVLHNTMAQVALSNPDPRHLALKDIVADLLGTEEARKRIAGMMTGLDIHYDLGEGHPLLGRRMPDYDVETAAGTRRMSSFLHRVGPVLFNFGTAGQFRTAAVQVVDARYEGNWELPVVGEVPPPGAILVRPDGYVAWAGESPDDSLNAALRQWFGAD